MLRMPNILLVSCALGLLPAFATTFNVGDGHPHPTPSDVPWESLQAGDVVRIHWRPEPFRDKWVICRQGTASAPIVVQGVLGPNGKRPIIEGRDARTRQTLNYWNEPRGVIKVGGASTPSDTMPQHILIENLEIRSARPPYRFTDDVGNTQDYARNAAAIHVEKAEHLTVRNCLLHDCGNGLFVGSPSGSPSRTLLIEKNHLYDNGNVDSIYEHNNYTEALGLVFQFNRFGPLRDGCLGNNLKDRSAGLVVRYNWIEGGNRQLDLVDATGNSDLTTDPSYRQTFVYGNILVETPNAGNRQVVHYGGDSGNEDDYRKGTLHFYHNTIISLRTDRTTLFRLSSSEESCDFRNNIAWTQHPGSGLGILDSAGTIDLTHSWLKEDWVNGFSQPGGSVNVDGTLLTGDTPGFVDQASHDYRLQPDSVCMNAGTGLANDAGGHSLLFQYRPHQLAIPRTLTDPPHLGALDPDPVEVWRKQAFGDSAPNPTVAGDDADPDDDQLVNLVEYALGRDPLVADQPPGLSAQLLDVGAEFFLAGSFLQRPAPAGILYTLAASPDLQSWNVGSVYGDTLTLATSPFTSEMARSGTPLDSVTVQLNAPVASRAAGFLRLTVQRE